MDSLRLDWIDVVSNYSGEFGPPSMESSTSASSSTSVASKAAAVSQMTEGPRNMLALAGVEAQEERLRKQTKQYATLTDFASGISPTCTPTYSRGNNRSFTSEAVPAGVSARSVRPHTTHYQEDSQSFFTWEVSQSMKPPSVIETSQVVIQKSGRCKTINDYLVIRLLGRGSFGKVKLVESITTGQVLAMKIIAAPKTKVNEKRRIAIQREIAVMKRLAHPNMVRLYEVLGNPKSGKLYLILQYISGGTIAKKLTNTTVQPIDEDTLKYQARQLVNVLKYLQINGVVHRDIKPDNILVDEQGNAFLSDFGVSAVCTDEVVSGVEGTPAFMAPEVCRGDAVVTGHLVDVWALGVSLFQLMYGVLPFIASNMMDLSRQIISGKLMFPDENASRWLPYVDEFGLPDVEASIEFKEVMRGMLQKDPAERWGVRRILNSDWLAEVERFTPLDSTLQEAEDTAIGLDVSIEDLADTIVPAEIMYI